MPIQCYCEKDSFTRKLAIGKHGATVIIAPIGLHKNWVKEFYLSIDFTELPVGYRPRLVSGHPSLEKRTTVEINNAEATFDVLSVFEVKTDYLPTNIKDIYGELDKWRKTKPTAKSPPPELPKPDINPALRELMIITTNICFRTHVEKEFTLSLDCTPQYVRNKRTKLIDYGDYDAVIIDEPPGSN